MSAGACARSPPPPAGCGSSRCRAAWCAESAGGAACLRAGAVDGAQGGKVARVWMRGAVVRQGDRGVGRGSPPPPAAAVAATVKGEAKATTSPVKTVRSEGRGSRRTSSRSTLSGLLRQRGRATRQAGRWVKGQSQRSKWRPQDLPCHKQWHATARCSRAGCLLNTLAGHTRDAGTLTLQPLPLYLYQPGRCAPPRASLGRSTDHWLLTAPALPPLHYQLLHPAPPHQPPSLCCLGVEGGRHGGAGDQHRHGQPRPAAQK